MCCCVEGACEEVDWGWDVELVGEEEQQEVVLVDLELVACMVDFGLHTFSRFITFMIFTTYLRSLFD